MFNNGEVKKYKVISKNKHHHNINKNIPKKNNQIKHLTKNNNIYFYNCLFLKKFYDEENENYCEPNSNNITINDLKYFNVYVNKFPEKPFKLDYFKDFYIDMKFIRENDLCTISYNGQIFNYNIINVLYKNTFEDDPNKTITEQQYNNYLNGRLYAYFLDTNYPRKVIDKEINEQLHTFNKENNIPICYNYPHHPPKQQNQENSNDICFDKSIMCNYLKFINKIPKMFCPNSIITQLIPIDIFIEINKNIIINQNEEQTEEKITQQITIYSQLIIMPNGLMFIDINDNDLKDLPYEYTYKYMNIPGFSITYNPKLPEPDKETIDFYLNKTKNYYDLFN